MASLAKHMILCHMATPTPSTTDHQQRRLHPQAARSPPPRPNPPPAAEEEKPSATRRWTVLGTALTASAALGLHRAVAKPEQSWGTHSFIKEKYFRPGLKPEEAVARIRQTAEGMKYLRHMLDTMSWRYVLFYVRLKADYLDADLKNALATVPEPRRQSYVKTANELVDNMAELDRYVRCPKVYESYLYYERTLKSLDELVALLA